MPRGESPQNLALMAEIDRQFLETPFYGVQQMTWHLRAEGHLVNIKRVRRLMQLMGLMPIYRAPRTSIIFIERLLGSLKYECVYLVRPEKLPIY